MRAFYEIVLIITACITAVAGVSNVIAAAVSGDVQRLILGAIQGLTFTLCFATLAVLEALREQK